MPSTVNDLFHAAGLQPAGPICFGDSLAENRQGVYVVAHASRSDASAPPGDYQPSFDLPEMGTWLEFVPDLRLDGERPSVTQLCDRLRQFWLADEPVLYVGQTCNGLRKRLRQYYRTPLGFPKPHAGGYWLKTLADLSAKRVYWAAVLSSQDTMELEGRMLDAFVRGISGSSRHQLWDPDRPFPFGNLEYPRGNVKRHGISKPHLR